MMPAMKAVTTPGSAPGPPAAASALARLSPSRILAIGLLGGALSGLLGVGGGTIMVPLLVFWAGCTQRDAHATSLGAIIPISAVSATTFATGTHIDVRAAILLTLGAVVGARFGAKFLARADDRLLQWCFGSFLLAAAALMLVQG
jgi:uncharacterized membrane protein YfcA